jgi:hypothetical protein
VLDGGHSALSETADVATSSITKGAGMRSSATAFRESICASRIL